MKHLGRLTAGICLFSMSLISPTRALDMRLATIAPESHNWTMVANRIASELKARPSLDLNLKVFAGAQLGGEPETLQQTELGLIDMGLFTVATLATRAPSMKGWFTPYLFDDVASAGKARKFPAAQKMLDELSKTGLVGLGYTMAGMRHILSRAEPVSGPGDISGKKIRITPFDAAKIWWDALGAVATPIPAPSLYQALQTGVIDLVEVDFDLLTALRLQEVANGLSLTKHMVFPGGIVISQRSWAKLNPVQQAGLKEAIETAIEAGIAAQVEAEAKNLDTLRGKLKIVELGKEAARFGAGVDAIAKAFRGLPVAAEFQQQAAAARN